MRKCGYCGRENPDDALACSGCASELQEEPSVIKQTKAGFWIRVAARVLDEIILIFVSMFVGLALGILLGIASGMGLIHRGWPSRFGQNYVLSFFFSLLANLAYHTLCEGIHGATVGKLCCGICVVREDGKPSNVFAALVRSLAYYIDGLFFGAVAFASMKRSPLNQRYGDRWAKTAVLKSDEIALESKRSATRLLLAFGLGFLIYVILVATGLLWPVFEHLM